MFHRWIIACLLTTLSGTAIAEQGSRIVSAGLFKNGLVSLMKEYTVPGPGTYTFDALGSPVHGTLWVESDWPVEARSGVESVDAELSEADAAGLEEVLVGREVEIGLRLTDSTHFTGKLIAAPGGRAQESRVFDSNGELFSPPAPSAAMYVVEQDGKRSYIARDLVAWVRALEPASVVKRSRSVLTFDVGAGAPNPTLIRVRYLTQGMAWAPSYRIDLTDNKTLSVGQSAVIRNELEDLDGVDLELISGFPNVEYLQAVSPFATGVTWSSFLAQLQQGSAEPNPIAVQMASTSNISQLFTNGVAGTVAMPPVPYNMDDGGDIYYHSVGRQSLRRGASLLLTTASASAEYEPIVEWRVNRTVRQGGSSNLAQEDVWDAVRFRNPLPFPMTTGPAMVESKGHFLGSRTIFWAGPGDETVAYISKALSIRTAYVEEEVSRQAIKELDRPVFETVVRGTLTVQNPRSEVVNLMIREDLSGALLRSDGEPTTVIGTAGPGQRNPSTKLTWHVKLEAGTEKSLVLEYRYVTE